MKPWILLVFTVMLLVAWKHGPDDPCLFSHPCDGKAEEPSQVSPQYGDSLETTYSLHIENGALSGQSNQITCSYDNSGVVAEYTLSVE